MSEKFVLGCVVGLSALVCAGLIVAGWRGLCSAGQVWRVCIRVGLLALVFVAAVAKVVEPATTAALLGFLLGVILAEGRAGR